MAKPMLKRLHKAKQKIHKKQTKIEKIEGLFFFRFL